ncbi:hypothetical protein DKY63_26075 [Pseudomonas putida]|uniref:Uncharacterized protein n=2 Tax=Pseudomonas putida TaxID=303 RepID=A0A2Z4RQD1_PSEPU|nr:hypothetical protein DKY63_26075 [Pseudomonas putida]
MRGSGKLIFAALGMMMVLPCVAAEFDFSSSSDFTEINLELKQIDDPNPQAIMLKVMLSHDAQRRLEQVSSRAIHERLRLSINGIEVSNSTIQSAIKGPGMMISVPREIARDLLPTLLEPSAS